MAKNLKRAIFFETEENGETVRKACLFYEDEVLELDYEGAINIITEYTKSKNCEKKDLEASDIIDVMTEQELNDYYVEYIQEIEDNKDEEEDKDEEEYEDDEDYRTEKQKKRAEKKRLKEIRKREKAKEKARKKEEKRIAKEKKAKLAEENKDEEDKGGLLYRLFSLPKRKDGKPLLGRVTRKIAAFVTSIAIVAGSILGGWHLLKKDINRRQKAIEKELEKERKSRKTKEENDKYIDKTTFRGKIKYANINETKRNITTKIYEYLASYNNKGLYDKKNTGKRLAHTWNEAVAQFLAFNDLSESQIIKLFDDTSINVNNMKEAYNNAFTQDVMAHVTQKNSLGKDKLLKGKEAKAFYKKYENLILKYNNIYNNANIDEHKEKKANIARKFYDELRRDFDMDKYSLHELPDYKRAIVPMIKAMNILTSNVDIDNKLSAKENKYFNYISSFSRFEEEFNNYESKHSAAKIANGNNDLATANGDEYSYAKIKRMAIKELKKNNIYYTNEYDRDVKQTSAYKENKQFVYHDDKTDSDIEITAVSSNDSSEYQYTTTANTTTNTAKKETETHKKKTKKKTNNHRKTIIINSEPDDFYDDLTIQNDDIENNNTIVIESDTTEQNEEYTIENPDIESGNAALINEPEEPTVIEQSQPEEPTTNTYEEVPNTEDEETEIINGEIASTNDTTTTEAVATQIVEDMAANPTPTETSSYQKTLNL